MKTKIKRLMMIKNKKETLGSLFSLIPSPYLLGVGGVVTGAGFGLPHPHPRKFLFSVFIFLGLVNVILINS